LEREIKLGEKSSFIINIIAETKSSVEEVAKRLEKILHTL
jgi:hypothetical protein